MKILLLFALVVVFSSCVTNQSKSQNSANKESTNLNAESKVKAEPKTDAEFLAFAKKTLANSSSDKFQIEDAYRYLRTISKSSKEYTEAKRMLADHEKKQLPIRKKNEIESQQEQRKKYETARIVIGMSIWEVEDLCGQANDTSTLESARGTIMTLKYEFSEKRKANDCFGTLTFIDYELDSIYRD